MGSRFSNAPKEGALPATTAFGGGSGSALKTPGTHKEERDAWCIRAVGLLESFDMADMMKRVMRDACRCAGMRAVVAVIVAVAVAVEPQGAEGRLGPGRGGTGKRGGQRTGCLHCC